MNAIVAFFNELWMTQGHNQGIMNYKRSHVSILNDIVNDEKAYNIAGYGHYRTQAMPLSRVRMRLQEGSW